MKNRIFFSLMGTIALFTASPAFAGRLHQLVCEFTNDPNLRIGITLNGPTVNTQLDPESVARVIITRTARSGSESLLADLRDVSIVKITRLAPGTEFESIEALHLVARTSRRSAQRLELNISSEDERLMVVESSLSVLPLGEGATVRCEYHTMSPRPALSGGNQ